MSRKRRTAADEPFLAVRASALDAPQRQALAEHSHAWHQLIYACAGVMTVGVAAARWVVPPARAIWVPAHTPHRILFAGETRLRTLYVAPGASGWPAECRVIAVGPLLAALIQRAVELGALDARDPIETSVALLIQAELREAELPPLNLPQPASVALAAAAESRLPPVDAARAAGLGLRTFERRFLAETGMAFGRWRRHRALLDALEALAAGAPVKAAAAQAGYAGPSAFVAAFGRAFGATPGRYFAG